MGKCTTMTPPDELPFDLEAPVVEITPQDYAIWYQDISEEPDKYKRKNPKDRWIHHGPG